MTNNSPITKTITCDGYTVNIVISKLNDLEAWSIEIVDEFGGATQWDTTFPSAKEAMDMALQAIDEHGIEAFLFENELDPMNLPAINRAAITITHKQAYVDWLNTLEGNNLTLDNVNEEATTYVVDEIHELLDNEDKDALIKAHFETIFESELTGWHLDVEGWPDNRDWELFKAFFNYTISSIVFDLGRAPVETEEF